MRHGFGINVRKNDYLIINKEKMDFIVEKDSCILIFKDQEYLVQNGDRLTINEKIDVAFNKQSEGRRGRLTFFCDESIKVFRNNHKAKGEV